MKDKKISKNGPKDDSESSDQQLIEALQRRDNQKNPNKKTKIITKQTKKDLPQNKQKTIKKPLDEDEKFKSSKYRIKDTFRVKGARAQNGPYQVTKRLSIMAWNVWNEGHNVPNSNMKHRYDEIVRIITAKNPDVICLQQTQKFRQRHLKEFLQSMKGSYYYSPDPSLISFNSSIILCKYPSKFYEVKFSKGLKTKPMAMCEFKINCKDGKTRTVIAHSVHLKARSQNQETQATRLLQLKLISKINLCYDISIAAGDYNIDDSHPDDKFIKYDFLDLQTHHKDPYEVRTLPQNQPLSQKTEIKFRNFSQDFFHQHQESSESDDSGEQMIESEFQSEDSFDGYSDSFYENSSQPDGFYDRENDFYSDDQSPQEDGFDDDQSDDNSFDSQDDESDNCSDSSGSGNYGRPRWSRPKPQKDFRRRMIQRPVQRRQNRQRRFRPPHGDRFPHRNGPNRDRNPRDQRQRVRLPPAHQIPDDNPSNTWTYLYYPDKSRYRFDRILMGCSELQKGIFRQKVKVMQFQRVGNYSVGKHSNSKFMSYLYDKIVRSPSDHLGVFTVLFLNF